MIRIYTAQDVSAYLGTSLERNLMVAHNRRVLTPVVRTLYIRNEDTSLWYSNVSIYATSTGVDIYSGAGLFGMKFYYGSIEPTERVWSGISYNAPARIPTIGAAGAADTSFKPFYVRMDQSPNLDIGRYGDGLLRMNAVVHPV